MGWDARTNTGRMQPGAVFEVLEAQQGAGHVAATPPNGTAIGVWLSMGQSAVKGRVILATEEDMFLDLQGSSLWHLRPWEDGDGPKQKYFPDFASQHWTVVDEVEATLGAEIRERAGKLADR